MDLSMLSFGQAIVAWLARTMRRMVVKGRARLHFVVMEGEEPFEEEDRQQSRTADQ